MGRKKKQGDDAEKASLVGRRVEKEFEGFGKFGGSVVAYNADRGFYKVLYDDGDKEELEFHELDQILVDDSKDVAPPKKRGRPPKKAEAPDSPAIDASGSKRQKREPAGEQNAPISRLIETEVSVSGRKSQPSSQGRKNEDDRIDDTAGECKLENELDLESLSCVRGPSGKRKRPDVVDVPSAKSSRGNNERAGVKNSRSKKHLQDHDDEESAPEDEGNDLESGSSGEDDESHLEMASTPKVGEELDLPAIAPLPPSSGDIPMSEDLVLEVFAIYSFLRSFSHALFLSPFTLDDFVSSLMTEASNTLTDCIYLVLLQALRRHLQRLLKEDCLKARECLRLRDWSLLDNVTWPAFLMVFLATHGFKKSYGQELSSLGLLDSEYCKASVKVKLAVLSFLCDHVMDAEEIRVALDHREEELIRQKDVKAFPEMQNVTITRENMDKVPDATLQQETGNHQTIHFNQEETSPDGNSDECALCGMNGNLICCDGCPAAYHSRCVGISRTSLPPGDWFCPECVVVRVGGEQSRPIVGLAGSHPLGVDPYGRMFMASCGRLFVLEQSNFMQCSYKYYGRDDIPGVLQTLDMLTPFCDNVANAIRAHWGMPIKSLAESNSSQLYPKNEVILGSDQQNVLAVPNIIACDKDMIRKEEKDRVVPNIVGPLGSIPMTQVAKQISDHVDREDGMVARVDSGTTTGKLTREDLVSEGASPQIASTQPTTSPEAVKPIEGPLIFLSKTSVEAPRVGLTGAPHEKMNGRGSELEPWSQQASCHGLVLDPYLAQNVAERDSKGRFLNAASRDHATPYSFKKPPLWEHHDSIHLQRLALYSNHYTFGDAAATAAANLALMTAEEPLPSGKGTKKKVTTIAEQINAFCKAPTRFCWPSWKKKLMDIPKDRCGWCFSCTVCLKRGCLLNQAASQLAAGAARVAGGIRPGKSGSGHMAAIIGFMLHMEDSVHSFLMGPWENVLFRKQWRKKLEQAFSVAEVKTTLLNLEAHLRPVVLTEDWSKALEDAPTLVLGGTSSPPDDESLSRKASGRKASRRSGFSRRGLPKSGDKTRGVVNWARRGKVAHRVSGWAILPSKVASKAGRQGGVKKIPGVTYLESEEVPKRSKQTVWRARVQAARTIADLALQVRCLDCLFRWDDLSTKIEVPSVTNNEENDGMPEAMNMGIYAKAIREKTLFYLIDASLIPRQGIRQSATFASQLPKDLAEQCNAQQVWVEEQKVPLSLLRDFEDRERLCRQNEAPKLNPLLKHTETRSSSRKKDIFGYLWERAGFSVPAKLVMSLTCQYCNLKVLASLAVQCHVCGGPFHKDCAVASHMPAKSELKYTCCGCLKQTVGHQLLDVNGVNKQQLKPSADLLKDINTAQTASIPPSHNSVQKRIVFIQPRPPQLTPSRTIRLSMKPPLSSGSLGYEGKEFSKREGYTAPRITLSESGVYMRKNGMDSRMRLVGKMLLPKQGDVPYLEAPKCYVCKQQYRGDLLYVKCERCPLWFHGVALGINDDNISDVVGFKCHKCRKKAIPTCPYGSKHRTHKHMSHMSTSTYNGMEEQGRFKDGCVTTRTPLPMLAIQASSTDIPSPGLVNVKDEPTQLDFPQSSFEDSKGESSLDGLVLSDVKLEGADDSFDGDETQGKETIPADNPVTGDNSAQQPLSFMELLSSEDDRVEELAELAMDFGGDGFDVFDVDSLMGSLGAASGMGSEERELPMEDPNLDMEVQNAVQSMDANVDTTALLNTAGCCGGSFPVDLQCVLCGLAFHRLCLGGGSGAGGVWTCHGWACDGCKNGIAQNQDDQKPVVDSLVDARILLQS